LLEDESDGSFAVSRRNVVVRCALQGKTVTLKIKTVTFEVHTRAQTMAQHTNDAHQISLVASTLLHTEIDNVAPKPLELRLMGKHVSRLVVLSFKMLPCL